MVTVAIPVYKRLEYLPGVLRSVNAQDYPSIELIVSDNGMNGSQLTEIVDQWATRPYRFRRNSTSVTFPTHFNQLLDEATGKYFVLLSDDDEITANYISELVSILESNPRVAIAFSRQEIMDETGYTIEQSNESLPEVMSGQEFIERAWGSYDLRMRVYLTNVARTEDIRRCGGYPEFPRGNHGENALAIKLCLNKYVAFSQRCTFRYRYLESGLGLGTDHKDFAKASKLFLEFLDSDTQIQEFASLHANQWKELKGILVRMVWGTYLWRWRNLYRNRLSGLRWVMAAFAMPFIPEYYRAVTFSLLYRAKAATLTGAKKRFGGAYNIFCTRRGDGRN